MIDEAGEVSHLGAEHRPTLGCQPVVAPLRDLSVLGILGGVCFLNVRGVLQSLDRLVQRAGTKPYLAAGTFLDLLLDRISVAGAIGERQKDLDDREGERVAQFGPVTRGYNVSLDDMSSPEVGRGVNLSDDCA